MTATTSRVGIVTDNRGEVLEVVGPIPLREFDDYHGRVEGLLNIDLSIEWLPLADPGDFAERLDEEAYEEARADEDAERPAEILTVRVDRPHQFPVGSRVRHVDETPGGPGATVVAQTLRVRDGVAYPTYILHDPVTGETVDDVLCTLDLVSALDPEEGTE